MPAAKKKLCSPVTKNGFLIGLVANKIRDRFQPTRKEISRRKRIWRDCRIRRAQAKTTANA